MKAMFRVQLKHFLHQRRISASELARRTNVPKQTISDWLAGTRPRNMDFVRRVADELGVEITDLYFGKEGGLESGIIRSASGTIRQDTRAEEDIDLAFRHFLFRNAMNVLFRIVDLKTGLPIEVSETWVSAVGWSTEELKSRSWLSFVHAEDRERLSSVVQRNILTGDHVSCFDYRVVDRNGAILRLHGRFAVQPSLGILMCHSVRAEGHASPVLSERSDSWKHF